MEQKRRFYRIEYPPSARPIFTVEGKKYPVADLSEEGLRVVVPNETEFRLGQLIVGEILFHDQVKLKVTSSVLRLLAKHIVLKCHVPVPLARIMQEQRHLIQRFGGVRREEDE